jgi:hypothetical protein
MCAATAIAQDRVSLRPILKVGDESRYAINASVETTVTPKGADGLRASSREELTATVLVRTLRLSDAGEVDQEAVVEAISFSASKEGVVNPPGAKEVSGRKIEFALDPAGYLTRCSIPESRGYLALADLLFSMARWRPSGDVALGEAWETIGRGPLFTDRLSEVSIGANTVYKLATLAKGAASIEGAITLNQRGSSVFNAVGGSINVSVIASGKGTAHVDVDVDGGRVTGGATEGRVEGALINIQPTAAGEKMHPREGSLVETAKFSIKLIQ